MFILVFFLLYFLDERRATSQKIENDISEAEEVVNEMSLASSYSKSDWSNQIEEFEDEITQWRNQFRAVGFEYMCNYYIFIYSIIGQAKSQVTYELEHGELLAGGSLLSEAVTADDHRKK